MRATFLVLIATAAAAVSTVAFADPEPPTPEQVAAASAKVDRLIKASGAPAAFGNLTASSFPLAVHRASGMRCGFETMRDARLAAIPAAGDHGPGVRCEMTVGGYPVTYEIVGAATPATVDVLAERLLAADRVGRPDLQILSLDPKVQTVAPIRTLSYRFGDDDHARLVQAAVSVIGPWRLTIRLEDSYARRGFDAAAAEKVLLLQLITQLDLINRKLREPD